MTGANASVNLMGRTAQLEKAANDEAAQLKTVVDWAIISLIPLTVLSLVFGVISSSLTIMTIAFDCGLSLLAHFFNFAAVRYISRQNVFQYPYGTGKIENFSSFFYGALVIPTSIFFLYNSVWRFIFPPAQILFGYSQVPLIPSIIRSIWLMAWITTLTRRQDEPSPMMQSYYVNFKIALYNDSGVLIGLVAAFVMTKFGLGGPALFIDPALCALVAVYMLYHGVSLTTRNFKSLIDLPLPEEDQLKILHALTSEFENFDNIGNIYTRFSGKTKFVQMELYFKKEVKLEDIDTLRMRMKKSLVRHFPHLNFHLIPLRTESPSSDETP